MAQHAQINRPHNYATHGIIHEYLLFGCLGLVAMNSELYKYFTGKHAVLVLIDNLESFTTSASYTGICRHFIRSYSTVGLPKTRSRRRSILKIIAVDKKDAKCSSPCNCCCINCIRWQQTDLS